MAEVAVEERLQEPDVVGEACGDPGAQLRRERLQVEEVPSRLSVRATT